MAVPRRYETLLSRLLSKTWAQKQGHKNTSGPTTTPDGRRKMRWRTAPAPWQKRFLHYRSTTLLHLLNDDDEGVAAKVAVKVAVKDAAAVAVKAAVISAMIAVPTPAATLLGPASGYEVEFFTRQFDRVGKLFHVVHVTLLGC